jgi:hypothetical protein
LLSVRWYLRHALSYRDSTEMPEELGIFLDHTSIFRWVIRFTPVLVSVFLNMKRSVGGRWRMDETYIKVNGLEPHPLSDPRQGKANNRFSTYSSLGSECSAQIFEEGD